MSSFNQVILLGNLTRDPELRHLDGGSSVCNFGIATNRKWTDPKTGSQQEDVCFIDVVSWGKQGEAASKYLRKGNPVLIAGHLQFDQWEDRETNQKRSKHKVVAERITFISQGGNQGSNQGGGNQGGYDQGGNQGGNRGSGQGGNRGGNQGGGQGGNQGGNRGGNQGGGSNQGGVDYDDIPF